MVHGARLTAFSMKIGEQSPIAPPSACPAVLRPEVADTTVIGLVCQPRWAGDRRLSIDRYEVDIADSIATLGAQCVVAPFDNGVLCRKPRPQPSA